MTERTCGGCTACCKAMPIAEIEKPVGVWCRHCSRKHGCRIYDERPKGCRDFQCQWLTGAFDYHERPDKVRVVIDAVEYPIVGMTAVFLELVRGENERAFAQKTLKEVLATGMCILLVPSLDSPAPLTLYLRDDIVLGRDNPFDGERRRVVVRRFKVIKGALT